MSQFDKFMDKGFSVFWPILPILVLAAVLQIAAAENPAVMERANASLDNPDAIPFTIVKQGQFSFYGVDDLVSRDNHTGNKPRALIASNNTACVRLWKTYIDRDYKETEINPLGDGRMAVFIFRGVQDNNQYTMKVDGVHLPAPASGPIVVGVTFNNPNFETYSYPKNFCSPFVVLTIDKDSLKWLGEKKVRVFIREVNHKILDAEELR